MESQNTPNTRAEAPPDKRLFLATLAASAMAGFVFGALLMPVWTHNVESAQVLAGVVPYGPDSPMGAYHRSVFSLLIQVPALLLKLGMDEWTLSALSSGFTAALAFSALSMVALVFSRSFWTAFLTPLLLAYMSRWVPYWPFDAFSAFSGHFYPILFPVHASLYGVVGLFGLLFTLALFDLGRVRAAAFCAGLLPGLHPTLGAALWLAAGVALLVNRERFRGLWGGMVLFFILGMIPTVAGFGTQELFLKPHLPALSPEAMERLVHAPEIFGQGHQETLSGFWNAMRFFEPEIYILILAYGFFLFRGKNRPGSFVLSALLAVLVAGGAFAVFQALFPEATPMILRKFLPSRWLNADSMAFGAVGLGILGGAAEGRRSVLALVFLASVFFLVVTGLIYAPTVSSAEALARALGPENLPAAPCTPGAFPSLLLAGAFLYLLQGREQTAGWRFRSPRIPRILIAAFCLVFLSIFLLGRGPETTKAFAYAHPVEADLRAGRGPVIAGEYHHFLNPLQLRTRRPIVLDLSQINFLLYVPGAAPMADRILKDIYGFGLYETFDFNRTANLWAGRTPDQWAAIREKYGATQILAPPGLATRLPVAAQYPFYTLYSIPEHG